MARYNSLSKELQERIASDREKNFVNPYRFSDENAIRRNAGHDAPTLWRPTFVRDTEKILHLPVYSRYADKTQVFSFYKNDDISRRAFHVQLVSRIARNIGSVLGLNCDLIEAISLGHDIGHTPFGHAGEKYLSDILHSKTGYFFNHNVHSVRVLDTLYRRNITLQTLDGILCHNGELELSEYRPSNLKSFKELDKNMLGCYMEKEAMYKLAPSTLEGCVMRISDIIAYLGKDRQDAVTARIIPEDCKFASSKIGTANAELINNLIVDIIENSYGKNYIMLSKDAFDGLNTAKSENYKKIYLNESVKNKLDENVKPMFEMMFEKLLDDLMKGDESSPLFKHHIDQINCQKKYYADFDYLSEKPEMIVADYIASMTDDYFIELFAYLFPKSNLHVEYLSYFDDLES